MKKIVFTSLFATIVSMHVFSETFDVLTYNVQMRPILDDNVYKGSRISSKLNKYDIALVQESFAEKDVLLEDVRHAHQAHFTDKRTAFTLVDSGLSTLSRFPIVETKKEHYHSYAGIADSVASKGILLTRVKIGNGIVDIYNTHMQAGDSDEENAARLDQATQIIDFINRHSPTDHGILLIGDFNMSPVRRGRAFRDFKPNHYSNRRDMILRTHAFQTIIDNLKLTDVQDTLEKRKVDDIERMLFRNGCGVTITPVKVRKERSHFVDEHGKKLSDSSPLVVTFNVQIENTHCEASSLIPSSPNNDEVRFFEDCNMRGAMLTLALYQSVNLEKGIIFDNKFSSIQIGSNRLALLTENADGSGRAICLKRSLRCFSKSTEAEGFNDKVSYVRVFAKGAADLPRECR